MKYKRVIARLDIKNNALVKGVHLEGLRVLGDPKEFAKNYSDSGIDEIIYMDVVASLYGRNGLLDLVKKTAEDVFVPLTVGGGIRSIEDVSQLLKSGADKVCINTAAVKTPHLISDIATIFGSSTLIVAIEAIKTDGKYMVFIDNGREYTGLDAIEWAQSVEKLGAGEILLTSVDKEGTKTGFDYELIDSIKKVTTLPLIIHGGMGSSSDAVELFKKHDIDAVCASSIFHYNMLEISTSVSQDTFGNKHFIQNKTSNYKGESICEVKTNLLENNISVRN